MTEPTLSYDKATRKGVITFPNGHRLTVSNVDQEKAEDFFKRHAPEFQKRGCILHGAGAFETRETPNG
jgi:hypothetical protein